jgi:hypothetical protein
VGIQPPLDDESRPQPQSFKGGVHRTGILGGETATYPLGHLEFDEDHLRIWGPGMEAIAERGKIKAIRFSPYRFLGTKVSILYSLRSESEVYFLPIDREAVRSSLMAVGWHVVQDRDRSPRIGGRDYEW